MIEWKHDKGIRMKEGPAPAAPSESVEGGAPGERTGALEGRPARDNWELPADALIIVCVRNLVLYPGLVQAVTLGRGRSVQAVQEAVRREVPVGFLLQKEESADNPGPDELFKVGTAASVLRYLTVGEHHHIICQGQKRFRIAEFLRREPFLVARVELHDEVDERDQETEAYCLHLKEMTRRAFELLPQHPSELDEVLPGISSPSMLADFIATYVDISLEEKQEILEIFDVKARLKKIGEKLAQRLEVLKLSRKISERTQGSMEKAHREYYLREQLKAIQNELGEADSRSLEIKDLSEKLTAAGLPEVVETEARRELSRLERMSENAAEYSMTRTYLEWIVELPWSKTSGETIDLERASRVLDADHFDLEKVKKRVLEFLAVRTLKPEGKGPILCLVGPPGTGKTSVGQSIARAMKREFVRISLGGCHDEAEIRGHRRTYIGALPGNIIQGIRRAGTRNPVFMLDEIDKLSPGFHGDPSSALLEVLDPEQNSAFRDNYLGVPFDLSQVVFITTANVIDSIPGPLRDRCEVLELAGYTEEEKLEIARRYLVGRQLEANGLSEEKLRFEDAALSTIIRDYTREAGCRNLEREIANLCRFVAAEVARGRAGLARIGPDDVLRILGPPRYENEVALRTSLPGVATGLAWTARGGDLLFVEATCMPGEGKLILTGQLGDVMKESAWAAISLIKSHAKELGVAPERFQKEDIHIHVPAGAIPKDGPSAGVTIFVAVVSLLTGTRVRSDVALTGEISLRGLVLPVGGIKEKVLAAHRAGIATVVLPSRNRKDLEEIPASARRDLRFVWAASVEDVLQAALESEGASREGTSLAG